MTFAGRSSRFLRKCPSDGVNLCRLWWLCRFWQARIDESSPISPHGSEIGLGSSSVWNPTAFTVADRFPHCQSGGSWNDVTTAGRCQSHRSGTTTRHAAVKKAGMRASQGPMSCLMASESEIINVCVRVLSPT